MSSTIIGASDPTADRSSRGPDADESTLKYATAFSRSSDRNCSPHSVDPVSVTSSPSQLQNTSVRLGRVPSLLQFAERLRQLHHRRRATRRIDTAEDPGVVMVAEHDPLVRPIAAADAAFDDEVRLDVGAHVDLQMQTRVVTAESIVDRQAALPRRRRERAAQASPESAACRDATSAAP